MRCLAHGNNLLFLDSSVTAVWWPIAAIRIFLNYYHFIDFFLKKKNQIRIKLKSINNENEMKTK